MGSFEVTIISILVMIFLGYIAKRIGLLSINDVESLIKIVINIAMPCMVFNALYTADMSIFSQVTIMPFIGLITGFIVGTAVYLILKFKKYPKKRIWTIVITVIMGNTAFVGFPILLGIYGNQGLIRGIFFDISSIVVFLIMSFILMMVFGGSIKKALKKILTFPPLWAVILGIGFNLLHIPIGSIPTTVINYLAGAAIPLIMIALGLSLRLNGLKWNFNTIISTSIIKLLIYPLVAFCVITLLGLTGLNHNVGVIEAAMPSGMLILVLAITYDLDFRLASDCIFTNTIFSLITIPIIISLL